MQLLLKPRRKQSNSDDDEDGTGSEEASDCEDGRVLCFLTFGGVWIGRGCLPDTGKDYRAEIRTIVPIRAIGSIRWCLWYLKLWLFEFIQVWCVGFIWRICLGFVRGCLANMSDQCLSIFDGLVDKRYRYLAMVDWRRWQVSAGSCPRLIWGLSRSLKSVVSL